MGSLQEDILRSVETAFVDCSTVSSLALRPRFLTNDPNDGQKVATSIEQELSRCESFDMSVAFITMGGIEPFLLSFKELEQRGGRGRILTTDYLTFSEPAALRKLASFSNIDVRMYSTAQTGTGFHTKGYLFHYVNGAHKAIIGSSNLTASALTTNKEWNIQVASHEQGEMYQELQNEFLSLWEKAEPLENLLTTYEKIYQDKRALMKAQPVVPIEMARLEPNTMQAAFVERFIALRASGATRGLLISATGTGKTYASAFALRNMNPRRALFLVHREQVLRKSIESYKKVFGSSKSFGLLSGHAHEKDADFVFATMQTMSRENTLKDFDPSEFDIIVIDEVHRAGAESYQRIIDYFTPKFFFGMTASPDRTDGFDIYGLFHNNIVYEIRLQRALEENLLCPFHYFGITDIAVAGKLLTDERSERDFAYLTSDERVNHIIEQTDFYGYSGSRVKGLMFCATNNEARELSRKLNERGYKTRALSGSDSQEVREETARRLAMDESDAGFEEEHLDYILSVDIFNEGIDIPEVNQVVMLRPTESPVVFVQQLGRGLRKIDEKQFVVVLDFIGNYKNNFMIPIALSGDRSYNKDTIRRYVMEGTRVIPGASSIHFDAVAREQIFESINSADVGIRFLRTQYFALKHKLGKIPRMCDFFELGEVDPRLFVEAKKSYYRFLEECDEEYSIRFTDEQHQVIEFISRFISDGVRAEELLILKQLAQAERTNYQKLREEVARYNGAPLSERTFSSSKKLLDKSFFTKSVDDKFSAVSLVSYADDETNAISISSNLEELLADQEFSEAFMDVLEYGLQRFSSFYASGNQLTLYAKYSRTQVCRALNWDADEGSTINGYRTKHKTCPIFVTYSKSEDIAESTKYDDHFIDESTFSWMTRSQRTMQSPEIQQILHARENDIDIHLFVKQSDGEGRDFYYVGKMFVLDAEQTTIANDKGVTLPIVNIRFRLEHPVRQDIYEYFEPSK